MKQNTKSRNKFMKWLGLGVLGLVLVGLAFLLVSYFQQVQTNERIKADITSTHAELVTIAKDLSKQTDMKWQDMSECYRLTPSLFGQDYKHVCKVLFSASEKASQKRFVSLTRSTAIAGEQLDFGDAVNLYTSLENTTGFNLKDSLHEGKPCVAQYAYTKDSKIITGQISCYYDINKESYEYLTQKGVLPVGEDR